MANEIPTKRNKGSLEVIFAGMNLDLERGHFIDDVRSYLTELSNDPQKRKKVEEGLNEADKEALDKYLRNFGELHSSNEL